MNRTGIPIWWGLLAAPTLVLGTQSINYALVQFACARRSHLALDMVSALSIAFSLGAAWFAWRRWRWESQPFDASYAPRDARAAFIALMSMIVAALCALIQIMMWLPQWLLSPCL
jgi:hypothetical protein